MRSGRTPDEHRAIEEWLSENEPYKARPGESGLYDEFGNRKNRPGDGAAVRGRTINRVQEIRRMMSLGMSDMEMASELGITKNNLRAICRRALMR